MQSDDDKRKGISKISPSQASLHRTIAANSDINEPYSDSHEDMVLGGRELASVIPFLKI